MLHSSGLLRHVLSYVIHNYLSIRLLIHTTHNQFAHFLKLKKILFFHAGMHKQIVIVACRHADVQQNKRDVNVPTELPFLVYLLSLNLAQTTTATTS